MNDSIRVVVVDDIAETRDHISKLLSFESDMDVIGVAASGAEALEVATRLQPDVVLMDINMPGMDGITTTEQLSSRVPNAAIVMMSVQGESDYLRRSMLAGAREFLVKPFSSDELCESIRQVHSREREKHSRMLPADPDHDHHDPRVLPVNASPGGSSPSSRPRAASVAPRSPSTWPSPR